MARCVRPGSTSGARRAAAAAALLLAVPAAPAHAAQRSRVPLAAESFSFSPGAGRATPGLLVLWSTGSASTYVDTADAVGSLDFTATAQQCEGAPHLQVAVDGVTRLTQEVDGTGSYRVRVSWPHGRHQVTFRFLDDHRTAGCDRDVLVRAPSLDLAPPGGPASTLYTSQSLLPRYVALEPPTAGNVTPERAGLWTNGAMRFRLDSQFGTRLYLTLVGAGCDGRLAHLVVSVDGAVVVDRDATSGPRWVVEAPFADGAHDVVVTVSRDPNTATCDGYVTLRAAEFVGLSPPP